MAVYSVITTLYDDFGSIPVGSILVESEKVQVQYPAYSGIRGDLYIPEPADFMLNKIPDYTKYVNKTLLREHVWEVGDTRNETSVNAVRQDIVPGDLVLLQVELPPKPWGIPRGVVPLGTVGICAGFSLLCDKLIIVFGVDDSVSLDLVSVGDLDFICKMGSLARAFTAPVVEPKNNDGRDICFWCKSKTKIVDTGRKFWNVCTMCKK